MGSEMCIRDRSLGVTPRVVLGTVLGTTGLYLGRTAPRRAHPGCGLGCVTVCLVGGAPSRVGPRAPTDAQVPSTPVWPAWRVPGLCLCGSICCVGVRVPGAGSRGDVFIPVCPGAASSPWVQLLSGQRAELSREAVWGELVLAAHFVPMTTCLQWGTQPGDCTSGLSAGGSAAHVFFIRFYSCRVSGDLVPATSYADTRIPSLYSPPLCPQCFSFLIFPEV